MQTENKWKLFALMQCLSDWTGDGVALFDALENAEYCESEAIFDEYAVDVWYPFEDWPSDDVSEHILQMASRAQRTETEEQTV